MAADFQFACHVGDLRAVPMFRRSPQLTPMQRTIQDPPEGQQWYSFAKVTVSDRNLVIFMINGENTYAMDQRCYHAGGPLDGGDIEDLEGRLCVVCPWHRHRIMLETGDSLYHSVDPGNPRGSRMLRSKGVKQRIHVVRRVGDKLFVKVDVSGEAVDSDFYCSEEYRDKMKKT